MYEKACDLFLDIYVSCLWIIYMYCLMKLVRRLDTKLDKERKGQWIVLSDFHFGKTFVKFVVKLVDEHFQYYTVFHLDRRIRPSLVYWNNAIKTKHSSASSVIQVIHQNRVWKAMKINIKMFSLSVHTVVNNSHTSPIWSDMLIVFTKE